MSGPKPNLPVAVAGMSIRQDDVGRFSLNDLHKAAGGNRKHGPNRWSRSEVFNDLVSELTPGMGFAPAVSKRGGTAPGTYVCEELVYAYAMWISPAFHIRVIRAYKESRGQDLLSRDQLHHRQVAYEKRAATSLEKASIGGRWMAERKRDLPGLSSEYSTLQAALQPTLL